MAKDRATTILNTTYRAILASRAEMIRRMGRYILIHDLEIDDFMYLFTLRWQQHRSDSIVSNTLATVYDYVKEIESCLKPSVPGLIVKSICSTMISVILSEAYFLKLLISINRKNKLKLDLPDEQYVYQLLPFSYQESLLKKADSGKVSK